MTYAYQSRAAQLAQADLELELHVDVKTAARIRELHSLKQQAVQAEDYDEAQRLKESISRIRQLGSKIAQLEAQKTVCNHTSVHDCSPVIDATLTLKLCGASSAMHLLQRYRSQPYVLKSECIDLHDHSDEFTANLTLGGKNSFTLSTPQCTWAQSR